MKKALKTLLVIFTILGTVVLGYYTGVCIYFIALEPLYLFIPLIGAFLTTAILMFNNLKKNSKKIAIGILSIFFIFPVVGLLYLLWKPRK